MTVPGLPAAGFIDQSWTLTPTGGLSFAAAEVVLQYDEDLLGGLNEVQIDHAWRDDTGTVTGFPVTLDTGANTATIAGVTGFSDWYLGNEDLVPVTVSGFAIE